MSCFLQGLGARKSQGFRGSRIAIRRVEHASENGRRSRVMMCYALLLISASQTLSCNAKLLCDNEVHHRRSL